MRSTPRRPGTRPALRWRAAGSGSLFRLRPRQTPFVCPDVGAVSANDGPRRAASGECRRRFSQGCRLLRHHALCLGPSWRSADRYLHQPEAHHPLHGEADQRRIQCPFNPGFEHPVVRSRNSRGPTLPRQGSCATAAMRPDEPLIGQARRPAAGRRDGLRCPERYPSWSGSRPMSHCGRDGVAHRGNMCSPASECQHLSARALFNPIHSRSPSPIARARAT